MVQLYTLNASPQHHLAHKAAVVKRVKSGAIVLSSVCGQSVNMRRSL